MVDGVQNEVMPNSTLLVERTKLLMLFVSPIGRTFPNNLTDTLFVDPKVRLLLFILFYSTSKTTRTFCIMLALRIVPLTQETYSVLTRCGLLLEGCCGNRRFRGVTMSKHQIQRTAQISSITTIVFMARYIPAAAAYNMRKSDVE